MKVKGMVIKIKDSHCIVLAKDGTYHKAPISGQKNIRIGAEIEFELSNAKWFRHAKTFLMVACLLLVMLGFGLYRNIGTPEAFAYVSLDINPSVELEINKDLKVIDVKPLNNDAKKLLSNVQISNADLYHSINSIVREAVREGFLKPGEKNYVLSTVTVNSSSPDRIDYGNLTRNLKTAVENKGLDVKVIILSTDMALHNEAKDQGLSTGKLAVYKEAVASGKKVTLKQVKENSITQLVNNYSISPARNHKARIINSIEIPAKDDSSTSGSQTRIKSGNLDDETFDNGQKSGERDKSHSGDEKRDTDDKYLKGQRPQSGKDYAQDANKNKNQTENSNSPSNEKIDDKPNPKSKDMDSKEPEQEKESDQEKNLEHSSSDSSNNTTEGQAQTPAPSVRQDSRHHNR